MRFSEFLKEESAQISAELIIIIAAVLAIALILIVNLRSTTKQGTEVIDKKSKKILDEIDKL